MPIDKKGFLGNEINKASKKIYDDNKDCFDFCYDLNTYAHKTMFEFKLHNKDGQECVSVALFIKALNGFQAVVILTKLGLVIEAKILLRSLIEALFLLKIVCEDKDFVPEYIRTDEINRLKLMRIAWDSSHPVFKPLKENVTGEMIKSLESKIKKDCISSLRIEQLAIKAKMKDWYDSVYRLLSSSVHTNPRELDNYVTVDENGDIKSFVWGPRETDVGLILYTSAEILITTLTLMSKLSSLDKEKTLDNFKTRLDKFAP